MYPGLEPSEAFIRHSQQFSNGYPYIRDPSDGLAHPRSVPMENTATLNSGFVSAANDPYSLSTGLESPSQANGYQMGNINNFTNGYNSRYSEEELSRSSSYTETPTYQNYNESNGVLGTGRLIQDVPHRPGSGRTERLWHPSGIIKKRKQPSLGRGSR